GDLARRASRLSILALGALVLMAAILLAWKPALLRLTAKEPSGVGRIQSLAVLPFVNLSQNPDDEYLVDGMTEELITDLAQSTSLRVISRTSVMQYKGARKSLREIAKALNVGAAVEGSGLHSGDRIRI